MRMFDITQFCNRQNAINAEQKSTTKRVSSGNDATITKNARYSQYLKIVKPKPFESSRTGNFIGIGTISDNILTITSVTYGKIDVGWTFDVIVDSVTTTLKILNWGVGTLGGVGTYILSNSNIRINTPITINAKGDKARDLIYVGLVFGLGARTI